MNILINGISKLDEGIPFSHYTIGCARVASIHFEENETLESYKDSGMVFDVKIADSEPNNQNTSLEEVENRMIAEFDFDKGLSNARNYILYVINNDKDSEDAGETSIIGNMADIVEIFNLPKEEIPQLEKNLPILLEQRQLCMVTYTDPIRNEECMMFVPDFDAEITEHILTDDVNEKNVAARKVQNMMNSGNPGTADYRTQLTSHSFIKMMLYTLMETGQKRYNHYHCDAVLTQVSSILSNITYYEGGELKTPTLSDMEAYLNMIKKGIKVMPGPVN